MRELRMRSRNTNHSITRSINSQVNFDQNKVIQEESSMRFPLYTSCDNQSCSKTKEEHQSQLSSNSLPDAKSTERGGVNVYTEKIADEPSVKDVSQTLTAKSTTEIRP